MRKIIALLALCLGPMLLPVHAAELHVAVAANFSGPRCRSWRPCFSRPGGHQLVISAGSSGQLYTQIKQGAPFDVFLSADTDKPQLLEKEGLAVADSEFTYAVGSLVLWSAKPGVVDGDGKVLQTQRYHLISVANPQTAPYGTAAQQVLTKLGLWEPLNQQHRIVTGENITQTWQFAASGNVDMAFVALSQVMGADGNIAGSSWLVPQSLYDPIEQAGVIIVATKEKAAAEAFMTWLHNDPVALAAIRFRRHRHRPLSWP